MSLCCYGFPDAGRRLAVTATGGSGSKLCLLSVSGVAGFCGHAGQGRPAAGLPTVLPPDQHCLPACTRITLTLQIGQSSPDVDPQLLKAAFNATQQLIEEGKLLAGHDISDGGMATTVRCLLLGRLYLAAGGPPVPWAAAGLGLGLQQEKCSPLVPPCCRPSERPTAPHLPALPPQRRCWRWRLLATVVCLLTCRSRRLTLMALLRRCLPRSLA